MPAFELAFFMPARSVRPCSYPGCGTLVVSGRCAKHPREQWVKREYDKHRVRGRALQERRKEWFSRHPLCGDRIGGPSAEHSVCARKRRPTAASILDHIEPLAKGGPDISSNWQSLCTDCARAKDEHDRGATARKRIGIDGYPIE